MAFRSAIRDKTQLRRVNTQAAILFMIAARTEPSWEPGGGSGESRTCSPAALGHYQLLADVHSLTLCGLEKSSLNSNACVNLSCTRFHRHQNNRLLMWIQEFRKIAYIFIYVLHIFIYVNMGFFCIKFVFSENINAKKG